MPPDREALVRPSCSPVYDDGQTAVYNADALDVMATLGDESVDVILTDPPYNVSDRNGRDGTTIGKLKRKDGTFREVTKDFGEWDREWEAAPFLAEAVRVLRPGGSMIAFTSEFLIADYLASGLNHRHLIFWRKTNPTPAFKGQYVRAVEMAVWQTKGTGGWALNAGGYQPNVFDVPVLNGYRAQNVERRVHKCQKPLELIRSILALHQSGGLVVDPYMGSGTTLRAAKDLGLRSVGTDVDVECVDYAIERLGQEVLGVA